MTASKTYDDFLTSTYTELGLDLGAGLPIDSEDRAGGGSGGGLGLAGLDGKEWDMDLAGLGEGQEFLDLGLYEGDVEVGGVERTGARKGRPR